MLSFFKKKFIQNYFSQNTFIPYQQFSYDKMFFREELIHDLEKVFNSLNHRWSPNFSRKIPFKNTRLLNTSESDIIDFSITKLFGLTNSKSSGFDSMSDFAYNLKKPEKYKGDNFIRFQTEQDFEDNINYVERRFLNLENFTIYHQIWNDRYFLSNDDCSHHFAALYRQCKEQIREYKIKAQIIKYEIDKSNLKSLLSEYYFILTNKENELKIYSLLTELKYPICSLLFYQSEEGEEHLLIFNKRYKLTDILFKKICCQNEHFLVINEELVEKYLRN